MQPTLVVRILGILLLLFSMALLPPLVVSLLYQDGEAADFATTIVVVIAAGLALWFPVRRRRHRVRNRDGFMIVALLWVFTGLLSALPLLIGLDLAPADAVFESVSGFTTTGATVLTGLDTMPPSLLFYRQELQWLGGIGVVVSALALLPMLGVGGMQLFKAETPGPMKDEKLTPRIAHTAQTLWRIYLAMTVICALLYWLAGMTAFDAVSHSLTTVSTGGFSTHDASIAYFDSPVIEAIAIAFMLLGAISFNVHFIAWRQRRPGTYCQNVEVRVFLLTLLGAALLTGSVLLATGEASGSLEAARYAAFEVVSVMTSTGYGIDDFSQWPLSLPVLLIFISFIGGCAGSTAGGMKVIRFVVMGRGALLEVERLVHPKMVRPLKLGNRVVPPDIVDAVWGFFAVYVATFALLMLALMATGLDQVTAFGAIATSMNNLGPGLGEVATQFGTVDDSVKWISAVAMLLGRLEIFTLLVLFSPAFWRR